jgi:mRNA interferase RelE/StbE
VSYRISYSPSGANDLRGLDRTTLNRIARGIEAYALTCRGDIQRMRGTRGVFRLRVGDYRIIFELNDDTLLIKRIAHRREVYR